MAKSKWVTISEAAKILDRGLNGVRFHIGRGNITGRKVKKGSREVWSVLRSDVEALAPTLHSRKFKKNPALSKRKCPRTGYVLIYMPQHPRAMCDGHVYEHWLVAEKLLGRHLKPKECVHHLNRIRDDNRIENLHVYASRSEHMKEAHSEENQERISNLRKLSV